MAWVLWLSMPVIATAAAALWAWWRGRPARTPAAHHAIKAHRDYLAALVVPVRGAVRAEPAEVSD
jgi:hypothetical protein